MVESSHLHIVYVVELKGNERVIPQDKESVRGYFLRHFKAMHLQSQNRKDIPRFLGSNISAPKLKFKNFGIMKRGPIAKYPG